MLRQAVRSSLFRVKVPYLVLSPRVNCHGHCNQANKSAQTVFTSGPTLQNLYVFDNVKSALGPEITVRNLVTMIGRWQLEA